MALLSVKTVVSSPRKLPFFQEKSIQDLEREKQCEKKKKSCAIHHCHDVRLSACTTVPVGIRTQPQTNPILKQSVIQPYFREGATFTNSYPLEIHWNHKAENGAFCLNLVK
jgi:hypothetical protein